MDLNNIELPSSLLAGLYSDCLIESKDVPVARKVKSGKEVKSVKEVKEGETGKVVRVTAEERTDTPFRYLGNNQKNILVVVTDPGHTFLADHELGFLTGILSACKLSIADVAIINIAAYPDASYKELTAFFKSRIVLLFAIEPAAFGLPMNFPPYQIQAFANNSFLYSPSLKELENDRVEKSKLWVCLKRLFNL